MNMWTAIVLIVMAAMAGEAWRHHVKSRSSGSNKQEIERLEKRIAELEAELRDRIATLERIVTDDKSHLKSQFEQLDKTG